MENMISTHDYVSDISDAQKQYCDDLREGFRALEQLILSHPAAADRNFTARCLATARTHLEIACMYALKGTVFEGKEVIGYGA